MAPTPHHHLSRQAQNLRRGVPILVGYLGLYLGAGLGFPWLTGGPLIRFTFRSLGLLTHWNGLLRCTP